jgi:protein involved in polysaccharide export with SLBB domain
VLLTLMLAAQACADLGALDPAAKPDTRFGPGYELSLSVNVRGLDEKELCRQFTLDGQGRLEVKLNDQPLPKIPLRGRTAEQARSEIKAQLSRYFVDEPDVRVGVARIPRFEVRVLGATNRRGPLALIEGSRLSDAIAEAGFLPSADLSQVVVDRTDRERRIKLTADFAKALAGMADAKTDPPLQDGDVVTLNTLVPLESPKNVAVQGEVLNAGFFPWKRGMTVRDLLSEARGMTPFADVERAAIVRHRSTKFITIHAARAMEKIATDDLLLEPEDVLVVPTRDRAMKYAVAGEVANPSTFDFKGKPTLKDAIIAAGGFKPNADRKSVVLIRSMILDPARATPVQLDYDKIVQGAMQDVPLQPGDVVQILPKRKVQTPLATIGMLLLRAVLPF